MQFEFCGNIDLCILTSIFVFKYNWADGEFSNVAFVCRCRRRRRRYPCELFYVFYLLFVVFCAASNCRFHSSYRLPLAFCVFVQRLCSTKWPTTASYDAVLYTLRTQNTRTTCTFGCSKFSSFLFSFYSLLNSIRSYVNGLYAVCFPDKATKQRAMQWSLSSSATWCNIASFSIGDMKLYWFSITNNRKQKRIIGPKGKRKKNWK